MPKPTLEWRREGGVLIAYKPMLKKPPNLFRRGSWEQQPPWELFARITYHVNEGYRVRTNDWAATDMPAADEREAKRMVEAMWALEG